MGLRNLQLDLHMWIPSKSSIQVFFYSIQGLDSGLSAQAVGPVGNPGLSGVAAEDTSSGPGWPPPQVALTRDSYLGTWVEEFHSQCNQNTMKKGHCCILNTLWIWTQLKQVVVGWLAAGSVGGLSWKQSVSTCLGLLCILRMTPVKCFGISKLCLMESLCFAKLYYFMKNATSSQ